LRRTVEEALANNQLRRNPAPRKFLFQPLMDKLLKAFAVGIVAFSAILAIFVGSRVDQFTMSMLGGAFLGLLIAVPTTLVATMIVTRADVRKPERSFQYNSGPLPQSPPPYWTIPNQPVAQPQPAQHPAYAAPQLTNNNHAWPGAQQESPFQRRKFFVIGESGVMEELRANGVEEENDEPFRIVNPHLLGMAR
jgi:hypothetical protein